MQNNKEGVKLLVDGTCVRHGKWLRLLGFDTEIILNLEEIEKKAKERVIITRNKKLKKKFKERVLLVPEIPFWKAMKYIVEMLKLKGHIKPFTRCSFCNEEVVEIEKEKVKGKVPYHVYEIQDSFHICPKCKKIYWGGSHYDKFIEDIKFKMGIEV